jgi:ubiquinone/menaquinone biosynthesis C-methylase UbiE
VPLTAPAVAARRSEGTRRSPFPDYRFAPNIGGNAPVYELENRALERAGHVLAAMRGLAPWDSRTIVDLGCGSGFWLPVYAAEASRVVGVEPDQVLLAAAARRTAGLPAVQAMPVVELLAGSAEHIPLPDNSADVVHARFAYFFPPRCAAGLAEVQRVLRPGGTLVVVDNDQRAGEFAALLRAAAGTGQGQADVTDAWWAARGASRTEVMSRWQFTSRADFEAVLRLEFPGGAADAWLAGHPDVLGLSYGYVLFAVPRSG